MIISINHGAPAVSAQKLQYSAAFELQTCSMLMGAGPFLSTYFSFFFVLSPGTNEFFFGASFSTSLHPSLLHSRSAIRLLIRPFLSFSRRRHPFSPALSHQFHTLNELQRHFESCRTFANTPPPPVAMPVKDGAHPSLACRTAPKT